MIVCVVGAAGHVGLPFTVLATLAGHKVYGLDLNDKLITQIQTGWYPYEEEAPKGTAGDMLRKALDTNRLHFGVNAFTSEFWDVIVVMMGTPIDQEGNPRVDDINKFFSEVLCPIIKDSDKCPLIILRSTVAPGTTDVLCTLIHEKTGKLESSDFRLVFAPERVAQGKSLIETGELPQLIGAYSNESYQVARDFFKETFSDILCFQMKPVDAELAKLMTNMYRYVNFALANEFMMVAHYYGSDYETIREAANCGYPRLNLAKAGPNVGGPCLYKDGKFLVSHISYPELIETSFQINEKMPEFIYGLIKKETAIGPVMVLGMAFKGNNDDTRNSLSFKLVKILKRHGIRYNTFDPHVAKHNFLDTDALSQAQVIVVMTPHDLFNDMEIWKQFPSGVLVIDIWKHLKSSLEFRNGIYWHKKFW
jgi:UDP-N-acetyl-D-mannosaminuronic acid dehydrogenase